MIYIDKKDDKKVTVSVREMSKQHWNALRKIAALHDMTIREMLEHMIEEKADELPFSNTSDS